MLQDRWGQQAVEAAGCGPTAYSCVSSHCKQAWNGMSRSSTSTEHSARHLLDLVIALRVENEESHPCA